MSFSSLLLLLLLLFLNSFGGGVVSGFIYVLLCLDFLRPLTVESGVVTSLFTIGRSYLTLCMKVPILVSYELP